MKLIKINEEHYVIVHDSEMLPDVFIYDLLQKEIKKHSGTYGHLKYIQDNCKKITHSTEPLEQYYGATDGTVPFVYHKIKPLSVSEVEEAINGYSTERMVWRLFGGSFESRNVDSEEEVDKMIAFGIECVKAYQELVKDLLPKQTEWNVEFVSGKLTVI